MKIFSGALLYEFHFYFLLLKWQDSRNCFMFGTKFPSVGPRKPPCSSSLQPKKSIEKSCFIETLQAINERFAALRQQAKAAYQQKKKSIYFYIVFKQYIAYLDNRIVGKWFRSKEEIFVKLLSTIFSTVIFCT